MSLGIDILIIHLLIVAIFLLLSYLKVLKIEKEMMVIVLFIPLFGALCALMIHFIIVTGESGKAGGDLEAMSSPDADQNRIPMPEAEGSLVVPLEDALIMDDASTRRSVIMDVLMSDTGKYTHILNQARMNEDAEVVHYATTAMAELSKEYELGLQEYSIRYAEAPDDIELIGEYIAYLGRFLESGTGQGQALEIQRNIYHQLLARKIDLAPAYEDYMALVGSYLGAGEYSAADQVLGRMEKAYGMDEEIWILRFRYYYQTRSVRSINEMIDKALSSGEFISSRMREIIDFWHRDREMEQR
ncbi:hypothetical protein [Butyrivibrio sp. MC2013]|uniref:hypothetical protein n=1 Tax=Butyrivibrio sp. MC2013 TaxID=1280686 RepID=UPI00041150B8|nr:hypothetical protein [Butyrivibrio sp. MC2013]